MLENVRIILVNTSHTGNIGSAARAMKTMGLSQLVLVDPVKPPDEQSIALAAGATDILTNLKIVPTLADAIADCALVVGASARSRTLVWPMLDPRQMGERLATDANKGTVALVFGRERTGLTNEELQQCHYHVNIPANPEYSSLNVAMAVQTLSYEIRMSWLAQQETGAQVDDDSDYPPQASMELFFQHLEKTLYQTQFLHSDRSGHVMMRLRRMFTRMRPDSNELNILRGILTSIQKPPRNS
ncbi:tRNA (cytosine(32)/uridine(32)-2'-O)-methyltransferase TrmJ [uncultured Tolumonas sp.]|uniref:tRNA (cytosine(32)/uridine(32)-2'-O)-methyltransferase TrmJ n=1 Tax=uncultured Tolumonas sp. TaxID=263765 RepID=UPI002930FBEF|nr:tRNA (cytosine(32)/uridine(32)-2'-O)-methyltransferase TrmJ [uncultured Tolumonas sp.]